MADQRPALSTMARTEQTYIALNADAPRSPALECARFG